MSTATMLSVLFKLAGVAMVAFLVGFVLLICAALTKHSREQLQKLAMTTIACVLGPFLANFMVCALLMITGPGSPEDIWPIRLLVLLLAPFSLLMLAKTFVSAGPSGRSYLRNRRKGRSPLQGREHR